MKKQIVKNTLAEPIHRRDPLPNGEEILSPRSSEVQEVFGLFFHKKIKEGVARFPPIRAEGRP